MQEYESWIKEALFEKVMSSGGIDGYSNYMGEDYEGWLCGPSYSRDSEALDRSNFKVALEMLGGENEEGGVIVRRCGHWGCGWFEQIMVKASQKDKAQELYKIACSLEKYPVLDDCDFSREESEEQDETFQNNSGEFMRELYRAIGFKEPGYIEPRGNRAELFEALARSIYYEDCCYCGTSEGWLSADAVRRWAGNSIGYWEWKEYGKTGEVIRARLEKFGKFKG